MATFGKRKKLPKKPKAIDRSKHAKTMVSRWDTTKFFRNIISKK